MKKSRSRLVLHRETVHLLTRSWLSEVVGGDSVQGLGGSCAGDCTSLRCLYGDIDTRTAVRCA